jgi:beta-fructofuranosidase
VVRGPGAEDLLLYTSVRDDSLDLGSVRVARADGTGDPWDHWTPGEVVAGAPEGVGAAVFRDPVVVREDEGWRMIVGGGLAEDGERPGTACVFGFASADLAEWRYTGLVATRSGAETDPEWTGTTWECPQLLRVGEVDVLVVSVWDRQTLHHVAAAPGRFTDGRFSPTGPWQQVTHGVPYAATGFVDRDGRPALLAWLREVADPAAGWAGALGLPLALGIEEGRVVLDLLVDPGGILTWEPGEAALELEDADGAAVASLAAERDAVVVTPTGGGPALRLPRGEGPVRAVLDGPVLEVLHAGRYGALPVTQYQL